MDSQWHSVGGHNRNNAGNKVDLTLKLGLPDDYDDENQPRHGQHVTTMSFMTQQPSYTQGVHGHGLVREGRDADGYGDPLVGRQIAWSSQGHHQHHQIWDNPPHFFNSNEGPLSQHTGSPAYSGPLYPNSSYEGLNSGLSRAPSLNEYLLLDTSPAEKVVDEGSGSSGSRKKGSRRRREGGYNDPNKRCSNYNCNTNDTPMWRKGPLGPKTLCNACGIKYRKEEEKRRARGTANTNGQSG